MAASSTFKLFKTIYVTKAIAIAIRAITEEQTRSPARLTTITPGVSAKVHGICVFLMSA